MTDQPRVYQASAAISLCMMSMASCAVMTTFVLKLKQHYLKYLKEMPPHNSEKKNGNFLVWLDRFSLALYVCLILTFLMTATEFDQDAPDDIQFILHSFAATALFGFSFMAGGMFLWHIIPMCYTVNFEPAKDLAMKRKAIIFMGSTIVLSGISRILTYIFDEANYLLLFGEAAFAFSVGLCPISFLKGFVSEWPLLNSEKLIRRFSKQLSSGSNGDRKNPNDDHWCETEEDKRKSSVYRSSGMYFISTDEETDDGGIEDDVSPSGAGQRSTRHGSKAKNRVAEGRDEKSGEQTKEKREDHDADGIIQEKNSSNMSVNRKRNFSSPTNRRRKWNIGVRAGAFIFCAFATFVIKVLLPCISLALSSSPDLSYFTDLFDMRGFKSFTILLSTVSFFCLFTLFNEHSQWLRTRFPVDVDPILKLRFARTYDFFLFVIGAFLVPSALAVVTNQIGGVFFYAVLFFVSLIFIATTYVSFISPIIIRYNLESSTKMATTKRALILSLLVIIPVYAVCGLLQTLVHPFFAKLQFVINCVLGCMLSLILLSYCQWAAHTDRKHPIISFKNLIGRAGSGVIRVYVKKD